MSDLTQDIRNYQRDRWTLADLNTLVSDLPDWDGASDVSLISVDPAGRRGSIQVSKIDS